jgi:hypothetical protein
LKNFYDMLSVAPDVSADDIKKAFRREIARYHPDKVQHLGKEFQEMAASIAADLTEAYRILMDPALRAKYDTDLKGGGRPAARPIVPPQPPASPGEPARPASPPPHADAPSAPPPPRASAGVDFVRRAAISKIRHAVEDAPGSSEALTAPGYDLAVVTKPKKGLFKKSEESVCLLVKFVAIVDGEAIAAVWPGASRVNAPGAAGCVVMLVGPGIAPAKELATAVSEQRRKSRGPGPVVVPVDVRDWEALFPPETPASVRSLIQRLKDDKR